MPPDQRILVAMLGAPKGGYSPTKYVIEGTPTPTTFSFLAIAEKYFPQKVYLLGTSQSIWEQIPPTFKYEKVQLDYGYDESEHWSIFQKLTELPLQNCRVIFDLTHGFRTLPIICLLSIIYYKAIHPEIYIEKILYGMYEARTNDQTPVVDLSEFIHIVDWLYAARLFTDLGLGSELSRQINALPDQPLSTFATTIDNLTTTLQMIYVNTLFSQLNTIKKQIAIVHKQDDPHLRPLKLILPRLDQFLIDIQKAATDWEKQLFLAHWYYQNQQYAHAIITLRECVITFVGEQVGASIATYNERQLIEWLIKPESAHPINSKDPKVKEIIPNWKNSVKKAIRKLMRQSAIPTLWEKIVPVRNRVGHAQLTDTTDATIPDVNIIIQLMDETKQTFHDPQTIRLLNELKTFVQDNKLVVPSATIEDLKTKFNP